MKEPDFMEQLKRNYTIRDPKAVREFIEKNEDVLPVLEEAPGEIRKHFPDASGGRTVTESA